MPFTILLQDFIVDSFVVTAVLILPSPCISVVCMQHTILCSNMYLP